jgi:hypothetical protein
MTRSPARTRPRLKLNETFKAPLWAQASTGAWHFVTLPASLSQRIRTLTAGLRRPFGSFRVTAITGRTSWSTSLFADTKRDAFLLPVKADVRKRERIAIGDMIEVAITFEI